VPYRCLWLVCISTSKALIANHAFFYVKKTFQCTVPGTTFVLLHAEEELSCFQLRSRLRVTSEIQTEGLASGRVDGASVWTPAPASRVGSHRTASRARVVARTAPCLAAASWHPLHTHTHAGGPSSCSRWLLQMGPATTCIMLDLLLQHLDETLATYVKNKLKQLQHT
jgi:hypothetical protein